MFDVFLFNFYYSPLSFISSSDRSSIVYPAAAAAATFSHFEQSYIFTIKKPNIQLQANDYLSSAGWQVEGPAREIETIICTFPIIAIPTQVLWGVVVMSLMLLLISCGLVLWQPTVIFFCKILFLFSVQAGRGGDDRKPLTIESLRKAFDNSCVNNDCVQNPYYKKAK